MGIRLKNIITDYKSTEDLSFIAEFEQSFSFVQAKKFNSPFQGIIGQIDEYKVEHKIDEDDNYLNENSCSNLEEAFEIIMEFEDAICDFSKRFPEKSFVYIDVDCFGGVCLYEGLVIVNGKVDYQQKSSYHGHIKLLEKLDKDFAQGYFEPFTRDFFEKKGVIKGFVKNYTITDLWHVLKNDFPNAEKYYVNEERSYLLIERQNNYNFKFTYENRSIEISGVIFNDSDEIIKEITDISDVLFRGIDHNLEIQLLDKDEVITKKSASNYYNTKAVVEQQNKDVISIFWSKLKNVFS